MISKGGRLAGKVALVTGASRGIGRAVALAYGREGATLVLCGRDASELDSCAEAAGGATLAQACDVTDGREVGALIDAAIGRFGRIDIVVNNAGVLGPHGRLVDVAPVEWERVLATNLTSVFLVTRAVLDAGMLARGQGCVINVSSGAGRRGRAGWGPYAVSKFGVDALTQVWADECKDTGVRFYSLNPGPTRTEMRAEACPDEDPLTVKTADVVAEAFVALADDGCSIAAGAALELERGTGRLVRWTPRPNSH